MAWPIIIRKTCTTFSSGLLKPRKFQTDIQLKTAVGAFAYVYIHRHRCTLSIRMERVHPMLSSICKFGVGFCCFLSLVYKVFLGPRKTRVMRVIDSLRHFFFGSRTTTEIKLSA